MSRDRIMGLLLVVAAGAFLSIGLRAEPRNTLQIVAGAALLLAGLLRLARSRASRGR